MTEDDKEVFYVLYNNTYGGFSIGDETQKEYNRRAIARGVNEDELYNHLGERRLNRNKPTTERYNPILIEMFLDKTWNIDGKHHMRSLDIAMFPIKYDGCIAIDEYDGNESVYVDIGRYLKKQTCQILYDETTDDSTKVALLKKLVTEDDLIKKIQFNRNAEDAYDADADADADSDALN